MNRLFRVALIGTILFLSVSAFAEDRYGKLPIAFEPNRGQFDRQFEFGSRGFGYSLLLKPTSISMSFRSGSTSHRTSIEMALLGANPAAYLRGTDTLPGVANYFQGTQEHWITHVPTYEKVAVHDVYPGVDAVYYGNQNRFEYDFIVNPGTSASVLDIDFPEATLKIAANGDLLISIGREQIRQSKPDVYQDIDGNRTSVAGKYILRDHHRVGFQIGTYNHRKPLVIDPQMVYSTFGPAMTRPYGIAVDSAGNAYIAGATVDGFGEGYTDAFTAKLNTAGTAFLWSNSFGSFERSDSATAIALDAAGNVYVTGYATYYAPPGYAPFPTTSNAIQSSPRGSSDAFVTKFDTSGNMLYSTLLGGSGGERADGITVDSLGNIYVSGQTNSADFPTARPFQSTLRGSSNAFVSVLNAQGSAFIYSTYVGGSGSDAATAIAVDASGNAYLTGSTTSADFPTANAIRATSAGGTDGFILKFNAAGSALLYGTYLGGGGTDIPTGIAVDSSGNTYVSGRTNSTNFPTVSAFQSTLHGGYDVFVTKVNSAGTAFSYSTYLGGSNDETTGGIWCEEKPACAGIAVNSNGNAYVTDLTASPDFPQVQSLQPFKGVGDAFVTEFSVSGTSLVYSTLLGGATAVPGTGSAFSSGSALAFLNGNIYVAGLTNNSDFPVTAGSTFPCCVNEGWNGIDGFVAKLADITASPGTTFTRVEQNSSAVTYTGTWNTNNGAFNSGGSAVLALDRGSRATFTFTGTAVKWIGFKDAWSGIANVYLDGTLQGQVDAYSSADKAQAVLFTMSGLSSGTHTLAVEVTGTKNTASSSAWIWVDAFDYATDSTASGGTGTTGGTSGGGTTGGTTGGGLTGGTSGGGTTGTTFTRVEQNSSAVTYTGTWNTNNGAFNSGGSAVLALDRGSRATFTFTGTAVKWIGYKDGWSGIANVYVDGTLQGQVDAYAAADQAQAVLFTISGLSSGTHTLAVEVTGTKNTASSSAWIWVDAFDYATDSTTSGSTGTTGGTTGGSTGGTSGGTSGGTTGGTSGAGATTTLTRVEQNSSAVTYTGSWNTNNGSFNSGGSAVLALDKGARATFTFTGTAVRWIGYRDPWSGIANVYIDGTLQGQVDTYSATGQAQVVNYTITGLTSGTHTITIEVTGTKDGSAQSTWMWVDAFDYQ